MISYSEREAFDKEELLLLARATALVACVDEREFAVPNSLVRDNLIRCHELARAVGYVLGLAHEDGKYSCCPNESPGINHSWLLVPRTFKGERVGLSILDVYAVGRLPQVQLLASTITLPNHRNFIPGPMRTDIDETVVAKLVQMMRVSKWEAIDTLTRTASINPDAVRLVAQLIGYPACPTCDYVLPNCRCKKVEVRSENH